MKIPIGKIWKVVKKVVTIAPVVVKGVELIIRTVKKDEKKG